MRPAWLNHRGLSALAGLIAAAIAAVLVLLLVPHWLTHIERAVAAYDAAALTMLAAAWFLGMQGDPKVTKRSASGEDAGAVAVFFVVLVSVAAGLIAAVVLLGRDPSGERANALAIVLALGAIALGWLLIQTTFALRYAHRYYGDANEDSRIDGGLVFPGRHQPNDYDFAYFSFVLGMTFQVSDVQITSTRIRRLALAHGLLSFAYNATILGFIVNVLAGLLAR
jgi:uncharacterized membrane protein